MEVILGTPVHGWVDLSIKDGVYLLDDNISDVPFDFVDQIVVGITNLLKNGGEQQAVLGLEPNYYVFTFAEVEGSFSFKLEKELEYPKPVSRSVLHQAKGSFVEILLPFVDASQRFYSGPVDEPHWPKCDRNNMVKLLKVSNNYTANLS